MLQTQGPGQSPEANNVIVMQNYVTAVKVHSANTQRLQDKLERAKFADKGVKQTDSFKRNVLDERLFRRLLVFDGDFRN